LFHIILGYASIPHIIIGLQHSSKTGSPLFSAWKIFHTCIILALICYFVQRNTASQKTLEFRCPHRNGLRGVLPGYQTASEDASRPLQRGRWSSIRRSFGVPTGMVYPVSHRVIKLPARTLADHSSEDAGAPYEGVSVSPPEWLTRCLTGLSNCQRGRWSSIRRSFGVPTGMVYPVSHRVIKLPARTLADHSSEDTGAPYEGVSVSLPEWFTRCLTGLSNCQRERSSIFPVQTKTRNCKAIPGLYASLLDIFTPDLDRTWHWRP
jgi:hypothetical protein